VLAPESRRGPESEVWRECSLTVSWRPRKAPRTVDALTDSVRGGWDNITDAVAGKLNDWLKDD